MNKLAVKVCKVPPGTHRDAYQKWEEEIRIMQRISTKAPMRSIVKAYQPPEEIRKHYGNQPILVMEYCDMGDLRQVSAVF